MFYFGLRREIMDLAQNINAKQCNRPGFKRDFAHTG
jgi:hypothetical protein